MRFHRLALTLLLFLAVVHDRYFIEQFASEVWNIKDGSIQKW
jgi:ATPase subunit of ABC transporter with duplicated ATPase domains